MTKHIKHTQSLLQQMSTWPKRMHQLILSLLSPGAYLLLETLCLFDMLSQAADACVHVLHSPPPPTPDPLLKLQAAGPFQVTIVNRAYHAGRHMVNSADVAQKLQEMPQVSSTRSIT